MGAVALAAFALLFALGADTAMTPEPAPQPVPAPSPEGPPKFPEGPRADRPFDPMHEKMWNIVTDGALPYNGSSPTEAMIRAAGELRKQQVLNLARAPWPPAQLRTFLPVTPAPTLSAEDAESHAHTNVLASPSSGLTGWRRSLTGVFTMPAATALVHPGQAQRVLIKQENATTNAYLYQRTPVAAGTLYLMQLNAAVSAGLGTAGVAFFDAGGDIISAPAMDLEGVNATSRTFRVPAPHGCMAAAVYVGKFDSAGGHIEVLEASFGTAASAPVSLQNGGWIRGVSHSGPGVATNFWTDGNSGFNNGGVGYLAALQTMNVGTLRYPGGEKSDSYAWAPPPWNAYTKPKPVLTRNQGQDWPYNDNNWADRSTNPAGYSIPVLDFDQFMGYVKATNAVPYLVLNYDSCSLRFGSGDWSYDQLLALAKSWLSYIVQMGYKATKFEFSNESFNTDYNGYANAYWYGWSLAQWAPQLKQVMPSASIGANGKPTWNSMGAADQASNNGQLWWQQILPQVSKHIDFLVLHSYPIWNQNYNDYANSNPNFMADANNGAYTIQKWAAASDVSRIRLAFTEVGAIDWGGKWGNYPASLGMGICVFDIMAQLLSHPLVDDAHVWTTRWRTGSPSPAQKAGYFDALQPDNTLSPMGMAVAILGKYFRTGDLQSTDSLAYIRTWAILTNGYTGINFILLNRGPAVSQTISFNWYYGNKNNGQQWVFGAHAGYSGSPDTDPSPTFTQVANNLGINSANQLTVMLPAVSVTVLVF
ncbi:hypothetical protein WJX81_007315 [Elliptochloris bilobata]|uniref:Uncharacterized protein n=1 Tax=Elliptochloris bilobata TaxID=381761 RepID=A0AAW1RLJ7_9CHLO